MDPERLCVELAGLCIDGEFSGYLACVWGDYRVGLFMWRSAKRDSYVEGVSLYARKD